jgi:hypothetical protein
MHHRAQLLLVEMGSCKLFAPASLEPRSLLCPLSAQDYRREPSLPAWFVKV